ncbi:hypothetical protein CDL15_Pgr023705 [Punica granatum]|nr:hypothetical protein CDL15_Pgr023705 [Punica granatum]
MTTPSWSSLPSSLAIPPLTGCCCSRAPYRAPWSCFVAAEVPSDSLTEAFNINCLLLKPCPAVSIVSRASLAVPLEVPELSRNSLAPSLVHSPRLPHCY